MALRLRTPRVLAVVTVMVSFFAVSATGSCSDGFGRLCTEIGCQSGVTFSFPSMVTGVVDREQCVNGACVKGFVHRLPLPGSKDTPVKTASLRLFDATGAVILEGTYNGSVKPSVFQPNGAECGPTCHTVGFRLKSTGVLELRPPLR